MSALGRSKGKGVNRGKGTPNGKGAVCKGAGGRGGAGRGSGRTAAGRGHGAIAVYLEDGHAYSTDGAYVATIASDDFEHGAAEEETSRRTPPC